MAPTKQAKVIKDFQKQSAQLDMTVSDTSHMLFGGVGFVRCFGLFIMLYFTDRDDVRGN